MHVCSNNINAALDRLGWGFVGRGNRLTTHSLIYHIHIQSPSPAPQVRKLNEGRGKHGRFLLGHQVVDSCCGGVFVLDVSTAQPFSGIRWECDGGVGQHQVCMWASGACSCWTCALHSLFRDQGRSALPCRPCPFLSSRC